MREVPNVEREEVRPVARKAFLFLSFLASSFMSKLDGGCNDVAKEEILGIGMMVSL